MLTAIDRAIPPQQPAQATTPTRRINAEAGTEVRATYSAAEQRTRANAGVLSASLKVSIDSGNDGLALLYRSAIDQLNDILAPDLGPDAIQNSASQDNTPEGTAGRIVSLSTGLFALYQQQHPDEDPDTVLTKFMDVIRGGFEKGFGEAKDILQGLKVLQGGVADGIDRTHELVLQGYADFEAAHRAPAAAETP